MMRKITAIHKATMDTMGKVYEKEGASGVLKPIPHLSIFISLALLMPDPYDEKYGNAVEDITTGTD